MKCFSYTVIHFTRSSFVKIFPYKISPEEEDKNVHSVKESVLAQLVRERVIRGDVNTELPTLARMVKIVVASIHEGTTVRCSSGEQYKTSSISVIGFSYNN